MEKEKYDSIDVVIDFINQCIGFSEEHEKQIEARSKANDPFQTDYIVPLFEKSLFTVKWIIMYFRYEIDKPNLSKKRCDELAIAAKCISGMLAMDPLGENSWLKAFGLYYNNSIDSNTLPS